MKLKNTSPKINISSTDQIKYVGEIPTCALTGDCSIDETDLTYLISLLLIRYCEENNIIDADLSTVDITCLIAANPDIDIPEDITIETLSSYFKNHICAIYSKVSDLQSQINTLKGITCLNDITQTEQNEPVTIDVLYNDFTSEVSGTLTVTIVDAPLNGSTSITSNQIIYTPDEDFFGNDQITYRVTKGSYTCTARISIRVNELITTQTITEIVAEQLLVVLQSNEYWDIGIPIGTKWMNSNVNLVDFDFTSITPGKGKTGTKWAKWAICNGYNGTEDFRGRTLRGFDHTDSDYNLSAKIGGSDTTSLVIGNVPPHIHLTMDAFINAIDGSDDIFSAYVDEKADDKGLAQSTIMNSGIEISEGNTEDRQGVVYYRNSGDGTDNINNEKELKNTPDPFSTRNKFVTSVVIQKIL